MIGPGKAFDTDRYFVVCDQPARRMPRHDRTLVDQSGDRAALRIGLPGRSPSPTWCGPSGRFSTSSASRGLPRSPADRLAACRRSNGPSCIRIRSTRSSRSPARTRCSPRASPGTRSRAAPSWPIPTGREATTTAPGASPTRAWASRAWSATSRTCRRNRWATSSAGGCSLRTTSATRSPIRSSRSKATCATRPTRS